MKRGVLAVAALWLSVAIVAFAAQGGVTAGHDRRWMAPPDQAGRVNPLAGRPETAAGGAKLFRARCSQCHDDDGGGTRKGPDLTRHDVQAQPDGALSWKVSSGNTHRGMPSFSFLPELQRWQLVLHLRTLGDQGAKGAKGAEEGKGRLKAPTRP